MFRSIILIWFAIGPLSAIADIAEPHYYQLFEIGNIQYKAGKYDSAKLSYSEIINNGYASAELYYNYGNSFFKSGNIPASILYYERALRLEPTYIDARHNLKIANSFIADNIKPIDRLFIVIWWNELASKNSSSFWAWFVILFISLACAGIALYLTSIQTILKQIGFFSAITSFLIVVFGFFLAKTSENLLSEPYAVVFTPSVNVKSEPDLKATVQFVIHEGLKVKVIDSEDEWTRITLADGNSGWIPTQSIEKI
jgi:tetratricopeptide (TPR) repeat protein